MHAGKTSSSQARVMAGSAEVAHVGVERLHPGEREHHRGEREEPGRAAVEEKVEGVARGERLEHLGVHRDPTDPEDGDGREPDEHDRPEHASHGPAAEPLQEEEQRR